MPLELPAQPLARPVQRCIALAVVSSDGMRELFAGIGAVTLDGGPTLNPSTYELLADEFECEPRGTIAVKGKGEVEAWYLVGTVGDRSSATEFGSEATVGP